MPDPIDTDIARMIAAHDRWEAAAELLRAEVHTTGSVVRATRARVDAAWREYDQAVEQAMSHDPTTLSAEQARRWAQLVPRASATARGIMELAWVLEAELPDTPQP